MTEFITDVVDPARLTGYVRAAVDGMLPFGGLLPARNVDDIEYEISQIDTTGAGQVARYRSWDTAPPLGKRPGIAIIGGEIPPLGLSMRLNEKDIIRLNKIRAGIAERSDQGVVETIYGDAVNTAAAVQNRVTIAHGDLLTTGSVTLTELGDVEDPETNAVVATFDVPGTQMGVTPAGAVWSNHAAAVPVFDLKAWEAEYRRNNGGRNPDAWGISSEIMADLVLNTQIRNLAPVMGTIPGIISEATVAQVLRAAGVNAPLVVMNDVERPALDGSGVGRVIDERKVIGLRAGIGATLFGITPNAATLAGNGRIAFRDAPGIVAFVQQSVRPAAIMTTAEGVVLPVLTDPNGLFVATV